MIATRPLGALSAHCTSRKVYDDVSHSHSPEKPMKRFLVTLFALLFAGAVLAACGGDDDSSSTPGDDASSATQDSEDSEGSEDAEGEFNDADVTFVEGMIPHHQQALEMTDLAETNAESDEVKDLAMQIAEAQRPEIETMQGWLEEWGGESDGDMGDMEGEGDSDMEMGGGMMSEDEMAELEAAEGAEFDEMFLTMMITHHEGAVEMAETEIDEGQSSDAITLAEEIVESQEAEIEEMNGLLESVPA
ncbi:DUF305 domain-containing protein [Iamia sp.]|uniref:DUF305 domain-containing protein n=1 Tax=Iamia sp. TaxID=2722710 RepID=UPI002BFA020C|nr:DUF305 domain-containing protein [Iamia sp.]HXH59396.1 DUF305 domain-containing protein [Iamia sp.]